MSSAKRKHTQRRKRSKSAFLNSKNFHVLSQQAQGSCARFASQSFSSLDRSHLLLKTNNSRSTRRPFRYRSLSTFQVATASQYPLKPLSFSEWRRTPTTDTPIIYDRNKLSASRKSLKRHQAITHKIAYYTHPSYKFQTAYDALPYLNGQAIYEIQGNLQIIFKHYASLSNAHSIVQWKRSTFHEIKSESSLLSVLNLLYFCNDFKILSHRLLSKLEIITIAQNSSGYSEKLRRSGVKTICSKWLELPTDPGGECQLNIEEFCVVLCRFAIILYSRFHGKSSKDKMNPNATDTEKWESFVEFTKLNDDKFIKKLLKNNKNVKAISKRLSSLDYGGQFSKKLKTEGRGSDLMGYGLARKIATKISKNTETNGRTLPFYTFSKEMMECVEKLLYKLPDRDWRKYHGPFINFGVISNYKGWRNHDASITVTNYDRDNNSKYEVKNLYVCLSGDTPPFVTLKRHRNIQLGYGISRGFFVHLDILKAKEMYGIDFLQLEHIFYVRIYESKGKKKKSKLVGNIPIYLKVIANHHCRRTVPNTKALDPSESIKFYKE